MNGLDRVKVELTEMVAKAKTNFHYNIFLIGFMGTGKSTIAAGLSTMLERERIEMDSLIEHQQKMKITQIFEEYGETHFRDLESKLLAELQQRGQLIVSCGGGVVLRPENVKYMKMNGRIVWLTATAKTVYSRVKDSGERPVLNQNMNVDFIGALMEKRCEYYQSASDITVSTDGKSEIEIVQEVISKLLELEAQI